MSRPPAGSFADRTGDGGQTGQRGFAKLLVPPLPRACLQPDRDDYMYYMYCRPLGMRDGAAVTGALAEKDGRLARTEDPPQELGHMSVDVRARGVSGRLRSVEEFRLRADGRVRKTIPAGA